MVSQKYMLQETAESQGVLLLLLLLLLEKMVHGRTTRVQRPGV